MATCGTIVELRGIGSEIKGCVADLTDFREWLLDIYYSNMNYRLLVPDVPFEDTLNAEGRKAYKKGLI